MSRRVNDAPCALAWQIASALPIVSGPATWNDDTDGVSAQDGNRDTASVLIVDDHPMVRAGLAAMLKSPDIEVVGDAASGIEAVGKAMELSPDVVLMDVRMPDMDGLEATAEIKHKVPTASVIIITGIEDESYLRKAIEAGASGYLLKGAPREMLIQSVRLLKAGGSLIDKAALTRLANIEPKDSNQNEMQALLATLSPREIEVLQHIVNGMTNKEIAEQMHYSIGTVKKRRSANHREARRGRSHAGGCRRRTLRHRHRITVRPWCHVRIETGELPSRCARMRESAALRCVQATVPPAQT